MWSRLDKGADKLSKLGAAVVLVLSLLFILFLTASAFVETGYVSTNNAAGELAELYADNIFLNILILMLLMASCYLVYKHCEEFNPVKVELLLMAVVLVVGVCFILSVKLSAPWYSDSYIVLYAAEKAASGDFSGLDSYFCRFPFQLGYVLYVESMFRIMGSVLPGMPSGYYRLALQGVNLLWLMLGYHSLIQLTGQLFQSRKIQNFTGVLFLFCMPAVFSCTFLYGNIPGLALGAMGLWMFAGFMRQRHLWQGLLCAVALGLAVVLKLNIMIFVVAVVIIWLLDLLRNRSIKSLLCLILTVAAVLSLSDAPQKIYEQRSGKEFGDGIPIIAWMAMGFSEGHAGPGWYDESYTVDAFMDNNMDAEATAEIAKGVIRERAAYFANNPGKAISFFWEKLRSQWNEPTYESLWINKVMQSYGEKGKMYDLLIGRGERKTAGFMNQYQQMIFLGVFCACFFLWKKREVLQCLLMVVILGGIFYHLLFEAKSQYILTYFVLMVPMSAYGYCNMFRFVEEKSK